MLAEFFRALVETGRAPVVRGPVDWEEETKGVVEVVRELDRARRLEMAGDAPALRPAVAAWAVGVLYSACHALAYRDVEAEDVVRSVGRESPEAASPAVCYSADLALAYLPDVVALARGLAEGDPLVDALMKVCRQWPLSSVGVAGMGDVDVSGLVGDASLKRLYVDRIIERGDVSRVTAGVVKEAVRAAVGGYPELAPAAVRRAIEEKVA